MVGVTGVGVTIGGVDAGIGAGLDVQAPDTRTIAMRQTPCGSVRPFMADLPRNTVLLELNKRKVADRSIREAGPYTPGRNRHRTRRR
jgi:hypothetical protein